MRNKFSMLTGSHTAFGDALIVSGKVDIFAGDLPDAAIQRFLGARLVQ
jgi:hypothetical protein